MATIIDPRDLNEQERATALLALAQRWTDLLIDLNTGTRPIGHHVDVAALATAAAAFAHPLLSLDRVADDMSLLDLAIRKRDTYENTGMWDDEDDEALRGRTETERLDFLQIEIDYFLFRLLHAQEPCPDCVRYRPFASWQPPFQTYQRCYEHQADHITTSATLRLLNTGCAHCGHPRDRHLDSGCAACADFSAHTKMLMDCQLFVDRVYTVEEVQK